MTQKRDYLDKEVYRALMEIARNDGYESFAVVFISQDQKKIIQPMRGTPVEDIEIKEIASYL
jgi:PleD family two-component response regulator